MKEEVLINLGFERNDVSEKDGGYYVEVFDNMDIRIEDETDLKNLIEIFKRSLKDGQVS
jgi:hypothetical protein